MKNSSCLDLAPVCLDYTFKAYLNSDNYLGTPNLREYHSGQKSTRSLILWLDFLNSVSTQFVISLFSHAFIFSRTLVWSLLTEFACTMQSYTVMRDALSHYYSSHTDRRHEIELESKYHQVNECITTLVSSCEKLISMHATSFPLDEKQV